MQSTIDDDIQNIVQANFAANGFHTSELTESTAAISSISDIPTLGSSSTPARRKIPFGSYEAQADSNFNVIERSFSISKYFKNCAQVETPWRKVQLKLMVNGKLLKAAKTLKNSRKLLGENEYTRTLEIPLPKRLLDALPTLFIIAVIYKMISLAMPYANNEEFSTFAQDKLRAAVDWTAQNEQKILSTLWPVACGLMVAIFSYFMVYFDSANPGVVPPSPFSPNSKRVYHLQRKSSLNLGYITAILSGVVVGALMFFDLGY